MADCGLLELLPPELRNRVYSLVLVEEDSIKIDKYDNRTQIHHQDDGKRKQRKSFGQAVIRGHHRNPKHRGQSYNYSTKTWKAAPCDNTLALLRVNKKTYAEAITILYGSNKFEMRCWGTLERFMDQIGSAAQHLRAVSLTFGRLKSFRTARRAIRALSAATHLRTLEVSHLDFCYRSIDDRLDALVEVCSPLLQILRESYKAQSMSANVLDVVKVVLFQHSRCTSCPQGRWDDYYYNCRQMGNTIVSFTSAQWRRFCEQGRGDGSRFGKVIHCQCKYLGADQRNQAINGMLKSKIAEQLGLSLDYAGQLTQHQPRQ